MTDEHDKPRCERDDVDLDEAGLLRAENQAMSVFHRCQIDTLTRQLDQANAEIERLRAEWELRKQHLLTIASILDGDYCQCGEPPGDDVDPDDPAEHERLCPVYWVAYLHNIIAGKPDPDPDSEAKAAMENKP